MSTYRTDEAFAMVPLWLVDSKVSDRAVRLYALLSGLRDYGTDRTPITRQSLMAQMGCSEASLDRAKVELEKASAITVERHNGGNGGSTPNIYTVHRAPPTRQHPLTGDDLHLLTGEGVVPLIDESSSSTSSPEVLSAHRVRIKAGSKDGWYAVDVEARDGKGSCECKSFQVRKRCRHINEAREALGLTPLGGRVPAKVAGKTVTATEHDLCDAIMTAFNEATGKKFAGQAYRREIIGAMREHPEVDLERHVEIISEQLEHPWWGGDPTPAVIYGGNGKMFDRALNGVHGAPVMVGPTRYARRFGRGMTVREMLDQKEAIHE